MIDIWQIYEIFGTYIDSEYQPFCIISFFQVVNQLLNFLHLAAAAADDDDDEEKRLVGLRQAGSRTQAKRTIR